MDNSISSPGLEALARAFQGLGPNVQTRIQKLADDTQKNINDKLREQPDQAPGVKSARTGTEQAGWVEGFAGSFSGEGVSAQFTWQNAVTYAPYLQDQDFQRLDGGFAAWAGHTAQEIIEASQGEIDEMAKEAGDDIASDLAASAAL